MNLLEEIQAKCSPELLASREHGAIAEAVSQGRTAVVSRLGGIGAVIETLGVVDGPVVLDALDSLRSSNQAVRWGWVLLERAELDFGSPVTRQLIDSLAAGGVMTAEQAGKLKALAVVPAPVGVQEVVAAMEGM
jgi:hypothetical protein